MYKILISSIDGSENTIKRKSDNAVIPNSPDNIDYQQFLQDVKEQGIGIVEGPDIISKPYSELRAAEYPPLEDQLDQIFHTSLTAWRSNIKIIKDKYPKTITGGTTLGDVPSWVQTEADAYTP